MFKYIADTWLSDLTPWIDDRAVFDVSNFSVFKLLFDSYRILTSFALTFKFERKAGNRQVQTRLNCTRTTLFRPLQSQRVGLGATGVIWVAGYRVGFSVPHGDYPGLINTEFIRSKA